LKDYLASYLKETDSQAANVAGRDFLKTTDDALTELTEPKEQLVDKGCVSFVMASVKANQKPLVCPKCSGEIQQDITPNWLTEYCRSDFRHFLVSTEL